jgi:hypothetical protein
VRTKMSLELVSCDGVDVRMGVAVRLPPIGYRYIELVRGKKDFLMIRALSDHKLLHNSLNVTPTFYKNKFFCANRSAYKNAYQIVVHMKNFPKINLV